MISHRNLPRKECVVTLIETPDAQRAPAKGRILDTANALFYQHGIMNVGVDRIIAQSRVTKATPVCLETKRGRRIPRSLGNSRHFNA
jgi:hypothetical protein